MRSRNCGFSETLLKLGNLKTLAFRFHVENILKTELFENHGVAIIMPGAFIMKNPRQMKRHFPIKPVQPRGTAPTFFISFPNSLHKWREVGKSTGLIAPQTGWLPGRKKPKRTFPFEDFYQFQAWLPILFFSDARVQLPQASFPGLAYVTTIKASDTLEHQPTVWPVPYLFTYLFVARTPQL